MKLGNVIIRQKFVCTYIINTEKKEVKKYQ